MKIINFLTHIFDMQCNASVNSDKKSESVVLLALERALQTCNSCPLQQKRGRRNLDDWLLNKTGFTSYLLPGLTRQAFSEQCKNKQREFVSNAAYWMIPLIPFPKKFHHMQASCFHLSANMALRAPPSNPTHAWLKRCTHLPYSTTPKVSCLQLTNWWVWLWASLG